MSIVLRQAPDFGSPTQFANQTDLTSTVPNGITIDLRAIAVKFLTSGANGMRELTYEVFDTTGLIIFSTSSLVNQAKNETVTYGLAQGVTSGTSVGANGSLTIGIPQNLVLIPGFKIRIYDAAQIDTIGDELIVNYLISLEDL